MGKAKKLPTFIKIILVLFCAFLALVTGFVILSVMLPSVLTTYTPKFSNERFNTINKGASQEDVHKILGSPFTKAVVNGEGIPCDWYSKPNNDWSSVFGWISVRVCYDKEGRVSGRGQDTFVN